MKIPSLKQCLLSKLNNFYQNFMKFCHIVKYYNAFFKFDNGPCFLELLPFVHENSSFLMGSGLLSPVISFTTL